LQAEDGIRGRNVTGFQTCALPILSEDEVMVYARDISAPYDVLMDIRKKGRLPVPNFAAGGIATPSDAALMMELGADGIFVGSGIFKAENPEKYAKAIVEAAKNYQDYKLIGEVSKKIGEAMKDTDMESSPESEWMQVRSE